MLRVYSRLLGLLLRVCAGLFVIFRLPKHSKEPPGEGPLLPHDEGACSLICLVGLRDIWLIRYEFGKTLVSSLLRFQVCQITSMLRLKTVWGFGMARV